MAPTPTLAGHVTSLDSQMDRRHAIFERPEILPQEKRTPFVLRGEMPVAPAPPAAAPAA